MSDKYRQEAGELFAQLNAAFLKTDKSLVDWFGAGIPEDVIARQEKRLGIQLPLEHRALMNIFNGFEDVRISMHYEGESYTGFYLSKFEEWRSDEHEFLIRDFEHSLSKDPVPIEALGPAKAMFRHKDWIAITCPDSWYSWYVDFAPEPGGTVGQILLVRSDPDATSYKVDVVARNFFEFMRLMIESANNPTEDW